MKTVDVNAVIIKEAILAKDTHRCFNAKLPLQNLVNFFSEAKLLDAARNLQGTSYCMI